ncbi:MAG: HEPN domain-containing protein, partial [Caldilineales bacterium]|nr:HEPN domain-containing protein [Caldilineales bacterium]
MDRNRDEALRWLSQARHDLKVAHLNAEHGAHAWACFLCQQVA